MHTADVLDLDSIGSCAELSAEHIHQAASSATEMKKLLSRVAAVARPEDGCPKILTAIAMLYGADWVEGDVVAELSGDDKGTTLTIYSELGAGIRERLLPQHYLAVPIDEFQRAVLLAPKLVEPLVAQQGLNRLSIAPRAERDNVEVPEFEVDEASLGDGERITVRPPPGTVDALVAEEQQDADVHTRPTKPPAPPTVAGGGE